MRDNPYNLTWSQLRAIDHERELQETLRRRSHAGEWLLILIICLFLI